MHPHVHILNDLCQVCALCASPKPRVGQMRFPQSACVDDQTRMTPMNALHDFHRSLPHKTQCPQSLSFGVCRPTSPVCVMNALHTPPPHHDTRSMCTIAPVCQLQLLRNALCMHGANQPHVILAFRNAPTGLMFVLPHIRYVRTCFPRISR